ncbi:MAG: hypothetical protein GY941_00595, partial [Planctomycetes bacterium]|nr:hypothetical protein [Planctomycetota bacterium]
MKKNVAGQSIGVQMITAADGSAFTGTVTAYVTGDAGTQAIGGTASGVCTHEGNGYHTYVPTQAETNYDLIAFTYIGTGAIPVTVQVNTGFPQSVDNNTILTSIGASSSGGKYIKFTTDNSGGGSLIGSGSDFVGSLAGGTIANISAENGDVYTFNDVNDDIDITFGANVTESRTATSVTLFVNLNGNTDEIKIKAY